MKTLKRNTNRILSMLFAIFMTVCAFLSLTALLPKTSASADETIDVEAVYNNCTFETYKEGDPIGGKYFYFSIVAATKNSLTPEDLLQINNSGAFTISGEANAYVVKYSDAEWPYAHKDNEDATYFCIYIPKDCSEYGFDASTATFTRGATTQILEMIPLPENINEWSKKDYVDGGEAIGKFLRIEAMNPTGDNSFYQKVYVGVMIDYVVDGGYYLCFDDPVCMWKDVSYHIQSGRVTLCSGGEDAAILYIPEDCDGTPWETHIAEKGLWNLLTSDNPEIPAYKIYELIEPTNSAPNSVPGGSSINPNGPGKADSVSDWEILGLIALSIIELICVVAYVAKTPNGGAKWIFTLILLGVLVAADIGLYLYFAGLI